MPVIAGSILAARLSTFVTTTERTPRRGELVEHARRADAAEQVAVPGAVEGGVPVLAGEEGLRPAAGAAPPSA